MQLTIKAEDIAGINLREIVAFTTLVLEQGASPDAIPEVLCNVDDEITELAVVISDYTAKAADE